MTIWEYRNTLDLCTLVKTGTVSVLVHRNQDIYAKYNTFIAMGVDRIEAKKRLEKYGLTPRMINMIIKELERTF